MISQHRIIFWFSAFLLFLHGPGHSEEPNQLTEAEIAAGFQLIFNGKDFEGWSQKGNWVLQEDGSMFRSKKGGGISYRAAKIPDNFELRFEWKVGPKSNSGIYYRPTQYEYQILDNTTHADGKNPRTSAASLYFGVAPSHDATKPVGEWNTGRIVCQGTVIQHWLNGEKVVSFDYTDPAFAKDVERLKLRGGDLTRRGAYLSLQDHGDPVWYRSIRLRELKPGDQIDPGTVQQAELTEEQRLAEQKKLEGILQRKAKAKE